MFQYHQSSSYQFHSYYKSYEQQNYNTNYPPPPPPLGQHHRRTGRVKFFNVNKGYGFIIPTAKGASTSTSSKGSSYISNDLEEDEVFVHHTSILNSNKGFLVGLNKGEEVEYELHDGPKGIYALYVTGPQGRPVQCNGYHENEYVLQQQQQQQQQQEYHTKSVIAYHQPLYHPHHPHQSYITYIVPPHLHPTHLQPTLQYY